MKLHEFSKKKEEKNENGNVMSPRLDLILKLFYIMLKTW